MTIIIWGKYPKVNYFEIKASKLFAKTKLKLMLRASGSGMLTSASQLAHRPIFINKVTENSSRPVVLNPLGTC